MDFEDEVEFHVEHLRNHGFTIVKNVRSLRLLLRLRLRLSSGSCSVSRSGSLRCALACSA